MLKRTRIALTSLVCATVTTGCVNTDSFLAGGGGATARGAAIIGSVSASGSTGKALTWTTSTECPEVTVSLNGSPADITFDDDCSFVVDHVAPAETVSLTVEIPSLSISGIVELKTVTDAELIELAVVVGADSLTVSVERRVKPAPGDQLPETIDENNVTIELPAGTYSQNLTVNGNNFTLTGEAGDSCEAEDWTILDGDVLVKGNNATFRNVKFVGTVDVKANNTRFVNCCFDGVLVTFGKGNGSDGGKHGHDDHGHNDGDDDDQGKDD